MLPMFSTYSPTVYGAGTARVRTELVDGHMPEQAAAKGDCRIHVANGATIVVRQLRQKQSGAVPSRKSSHNTWTI